MSRGPEPRRPPARRPRPGRAGGRAALLGDRADRLRGAHAGPPGPPTLARSRSRSAAAWRRLRSCSARPERRSGNFVSDVVGIGEEDAKPALRSPPAAGELLVESEQGPWIVREDGSKRLLGDYEEASWSPRGLYVAATDGRELLAVEPDGTCDGRSPRPRDVHDPRWAGWRHADRLSQRRGPLGGQRRRQRSATDRPQRADRSRRNGAAIGEGQARARRRLSTSLPTATDEARSGLSTATPATDSQCQDVQPLPRRARENRLGDRSRRSPPGIDPRRRARRESWSPAVGRARFCSRARPAHRPDLVARRPLAARRLAGGRPMAVHPDQALGRGDRDRPISEQFAPGATGAASFPRVSGWILPQR